VRCLTVDECQTWRNQLSRRRRWTRQTTCVTPLDRLPWFTATLVEQVQPFEQALLIVDGVVLGDLPKLDALRRAAGETRPIHAAPGHRFENDPAALRAALEAALSGWTDLRVIFSPPRHALSADHDEYTTFFSESPGKVADVRHALQKGRVNLQEYTAKDP
jgi:hypothetical protein